MGVGPDTHGVDIRRQGVRSTELVVGFPGRDVEMRGEAENWGHLDLRHLARGLRPKVEPDHRDRKSTRLNSSHRCISYAVFCLKKKKKHESVNGIKLIT